MNIRSALSPEGDNEDALSDISIENLPVGDIEIDIPEDEPAELTEEEKQERRRELIRRQGEIQQSYERILSSPIEDIHEENKSDPYVESHCSNTEDLHGDPLSTDNLVVFIKESSELGECYLRTDLEDSFSNAEEVYIWKGPPSPFIAYSLNGNITRGERDTDNPIFKLPYSGIWVDKIVVNAALELPLDSAVTTIYLRRGEKQSIGSGFAMSALHGQWGGHWRPTIGINGKPYAEYVNRGNAEPDDRHYIYTTD